MSMLLPPQMLNTMAPNCALEREHTPRPSMPNPIRRYMLPLLQRSRAGMGLTSFRERDSLHESDMWVVEGLTHRYPTKVLAEMLSTCPQYCGTATRMDLIGNSTPTISKNRLTLQPADPAGPNAGLPARPTPTVRDVVVSGGDVATFPGRGWNRSSCSCSRLTPSAISAWRRRRWPRCRNTGCK